MTRVTHKGAIVAGRRRARTCRGWHHHTSLYVPRPHNHRIMAGSWSHGRMVAWSHGRMVAWSDHAVWWERHTCWNGFTSTCLHHHHLGSTLVRQLLQISHPLLEAFFLRVRALAEPVVVSEHQNVRPTGGAPHRQVARVRMRVAAAVEWQQRRDTRLRVPRALHPHLFNDGHHACARVGCVGVITVPFRRSSCTAAPSQVPPACEQRRAGSPRVCQPRARM